MTAIALPNRVPSGTPAGGRFATTHHAVPDVALTGPAAADFDAAFEASRGAELARELAALPKAPVREIIRASRTTDLLRDSYPDYWADGVAPQERADAVRNLEAALPHLPEAERARYIELIRFAVHTEMKSYADEGYILHPDHPYEVLIERSDYSTEEDLLEIGHDENRQAWATLADTAALHAITADQNYPSLQQA